MNRFIVTVAPSFLETEAKELKNVDKDAKIIRMFDDSLLLVESKNKNFAEKINEIDPIFIRHIFPVDLEFKISGKRDQDLPNILDVAKRNFNIGKAGKFAIQCKCVGKEYDYNSKDVEVLVGKQIESAGGIPSFKKSDPNRKIFFLFLRGTKCYVGAAEQRQTLNEEWDEYRLFSREKCNVCRAEFKLIEALRKFGITPKGNALDIGAAPGGWTYVLASLGMNVTAVDPAQLSQKVEKMKGVIHLRKRFSPDLVEGAFDLLVNDMNLEGKESSEIMNLAAQKLNPGAFAIMTLKLVTKRVDTHLEEAREILAKKYEILKIKSLFHNRKEVIILLKKK